MQAGIFTTFDVVGGAGREELFGVVPREAGHHPARVGEGEGIERGSPAVVGLADEEFAVEPQNVERPEDIEVLEALIAPPP